MVERHWGTVAKLANTLLLHARLNRKFFYYAAKYAQYIHNILPVKDLYDAEGLPTTPHFLATNRKPAVKQFKVFGCPAIFKRYETYEKGKVVKNKYSQQGTCGIFVGIPDDSAGWLFYVPDARKTYISMDAVFDEQFTSPLYLPDLPYQGAIRLRNVKACRLNSEPIIEHTGEPTGCNEHYPSDTDLPTPQPKRSKVDMTRLKNTRNTEAYNVKISHSLQDTNQITQNKDQNDHIIHNFFTSVLNKPVDNFDHSEYLSIAHELKEDRQSQEKQNESHINLSDFIPEPTSINHVLKLSQPIRDRWGDAIRKEIQGLFDNDTFDIHKKVLPADEVIPAKCAFKTKLNSYGGLDKLKARICLRGDMQIKETFNNWSPTASTRLLKCFLADAILNKSKIYQLDFIQAFIQSDTKRRIFVILDKVYSTFCPKLSNHIGRPLRLKKCLYGADFSGKNWYETLDTFLTSDLNFIRSRVEGCLYVY